MKKQNLFTFILIIIALSVHNIVLPTLYWNWQSIDIQATQFPTSFMWGVTTLAHEIEGYAKTSTWYAWEKQITPNGQPFAFTRSGIASAHSQHYKEDIQLIKNLGINTYCFSINWSRIEPEEGYFDEDALHYYVNVCDELLNNNIIPIIVLKDYCDPLWFGYLGGFEKESNLYFFERYCTKIYELLGSKVTYWITFWAPEAYAMMGYLAGTIPPGVQYIHRAATILKNELEAHIRVYKIIKSFPQSNASKVGIIKHVHSLEPWYFWDKVSCSLAHILTNTLFYNFFTTGTLSLKIPLPGKIGSWVTHTNAYAPKSLDFIGINYYSHGYIKNLFNHINNPNEIPTDIAGISIYPEGLYQAIKEVSDNIATKLNIPIIITQNGIATTDESIRDFYLKRHIYAVSKALKDGYNVLGYCYYSLLDGFSWGSFDKKFGLFAVNPTTLERTFKSGSKYYCDVIKKHQLH